MFPLHKSPTGLLELFRLRTLGANPPKFADHIQPTVDVSEFYGADTKLVTSGAPTVGALAALVENVVLTGPVRIHTIGASLTIGAAAATDVQLAVQLHDPFTNVAATIGSMFRPNAAIGTVFRIGFPFPHALVIPAGWTLRGIANGTAAGADHSLVVSALIDNITGAV